MTIDRSLNARPQSAEGMDADSPRGAASLSLAGPVRRPRLDPDRGLDPLIDREWLVTNGVGGYASGTLAGVLTRRYHGLLVAALPNPLGRTVMLNHLIERVAAAGGEMVELHPPFPLEFQLECGLPVWRYRIAGQMITRRLVMPYRQNTVTVTYELDDGEPMRLQLQPAVHFRSHESPVSTPLEDGYRLAALDDLYEISGPPAYPPLRLRLVGGEPTLVLDASRLSELLYPVEEARGYEFSGALWTPGHLFVTLRPGVPVSLVASTESAEVITALTPDAAFAAEDARRRRLISMAHLDESDDVAAELVLAADQFVIAPAGRVADSARASAMGDELRTIIAGYHWFTDWGRDTMIALEGLTLATGRYREAAAILRAFAQHVEGGLIPNMFPDGSDRGLYHTADATLWFFHAIERYRLATGDANLVRDLLPRLRDVIGAHRRGTSFGIGVDPVDGLLRQGAEGYQLTWMDAKVEGWVVTPRRGKAVEINALWYNALRLAAGWLRDLGEPGEAAELEAEADRVHASFNSRFWYDAGGYLFDVVDGETGDSTDCRPNQLFAISLDHPVLLQDRWHRVLEVVEERLLTPVGLRSLEPGNAAFQPRYFGDLRARDAAYHQGTVWGWLIGPWVDAWLRVHPGEEAKAARYLEGLVSHLDDFGVGTVAEIFDAEAPFTPRGCIAQAWSVAELLRCLLRCLRRCHSPAQ
jgi:predicted glycogen debranching enzyme